MSTNTIKVRPQTQLNELNDFYGIFFEDLNHAADGGLYPELVRNKEFEFCEIDNSSYTYTTAWKSLNSETIDETVSIESSRPYNKKNPHYAVITVDGKSGIVNEGFAGGMVLDEGKQYKFSCYARVEGELRIEYKVKTLTQSAIEGTFTAGNEWTKIENVITADNSITNGYLEITATGVGKLYLDYVSVFPEDTFMNRPNGMRKDIATLLSDMKPKFMRFPGGCLVHDGSLNEEDRNSLYRWKNTIGELTNRGSRRNNWGYNQTLGIGYFEYFRFCEDIGAKPLPVLPAGYDPHHKRICPMNELQPWIDDALDLIEFANGDSTSKWGKIRAELGHNEPFNLEYLGIGNEEVGEAFPERYAAFHKAIKDIYPDIKLINSSGPFSSGGEFDRGWNSAKENNSDFVDEHYYQAPEWFIANHHRYDSYDANGPKVFLGEYASWGNTFYNALVEASYMIGMENNADKVGLACYAPMLCNVNYTNWKPDMIWFNNREAFGTPNYYVQKMFMENQGDVTIAVECDELHEQIVKEESPINGQVALACVDNVTAYTDIRIEDMDSDAVIIPEDVILKNDDNKRIIGYVPFKNYRIIMKATKLEGPKGFMIDFAYTSDEDRHFWELGGWQNQDSTVCENINGKNICLTQNLFTVEQRVPYELKIEVNERKITTFVDGKLIDDTESRIAAPEKLYFTAAVERSSGDIIVKAVNISGEDIVTTIDIDGITADEKLIIDASILEGFERDDENSFDNPTQVSPRKVRTIGVNNGCEYTFKKDSLSILRIRKTISANPVIEGQYADPDIHEFDGRYYIYPTTDGFEGWSGTKFHAFSSEDMISWVDEGIIVDVASEQVPWAIGSAWAPCIEKKNNKFYYYFCAKRKDGASCIGVAVSESPVGPFIADDEPLLVPEMCKDIHMGQTIDPSVYTEDGKSYILFGNGSDNCAAIAELSKDMKSIVCGTMKNIEGTFDFRESINVLKHDGIYHFTWSCDDTGSENYHINYGVSDNLYGPIEYKGSILEKDVDNDILGTGHHSIFKKEDRDEYYIAYHRFVTPLHQYDSGFGFHREVCIDRLYFDVNTGLITKVNPK